MSFLKKFNRQRSVDLEEEAKKKEEKEEKEKAKELKRSKRHSVHVSSRRDKPGETTVEDVKSKDDSYVDDKALRKKKEADLKERERRKFKDMSGMVMSSPNEYPVFIVHYLGRMPADAEYGREAVEDPVHQLCKLREKQKLPKTLVAFNVDGMMCREVSGPFLKPKKEGMTFFIPLHHITYGVASLTHPQVFAIITKMTDDPSPVNQVLVLHAFLCDKTEEAQALTYWQLQAYIEAFEDLKRKRMLKMRRKQAMGEPIPEAPGASTSQDGAGGSGTNGAASSSGRPGGGASRSVVLPTSAPNPAHQNPPPSHAPVQTAVVKPKRTNSSTSTTSSSSSSSSSTKKTTPDASRKSSNASRKSSGDNGQDDDAIIQIPQKPAPVKLKSGQWPPKRGPPKQLRGPPPDIGTIQVDIPPPGSTKKTGQGSGDSKDSAYGEWEEEFPITFSPGTTGPTSPQSPPPGSTSPQSPLPGSSIPGIAPRRTSESGEMAAGRTSSFESRISELQNLVQMDAEKLKDLMIKEYPTLSRKIYWKMSIDQNGVVTRREDEDKKNNGEKKITNNDHVNDDSVV